MKTFKVWLKEAKKEFKPTHVGWHGTPDARGIETIGFRTLRQRHTGKDENEIHWAAAEYRVARSYADDHRAFDYQNAVPKTIPVELSMKNPKVIHWHGGPFRGRHKDGVGFSIHDHIDAARKDGHDGFVVHNIIDDYDAKGKPSTIMGVFSHKNIRIKKT